MKEAMYPQIVDKETSNLEINYLCRTEMFQTA